jgi:hypothetical protein
VSERNAEQADAAAGAEPFNANGDGDGWRCACGAGRHAQDPHRCARGHVAVDNSIARQTGIYARVPPPEVKEAVEQLVAGVVSDLGGTSALSTIERGYIEKLGAVDATVRLLAHDIAARGLLTESGGVRRVHDAFLNAIDRWDRLAQRLGTKRRPRRVDTLEAALAAEPEAR